MFKIYAKLTHALRCLNSDILALGIHRDLALSDFEESRKTFHWEACQYSGPIVILPYITLSVFFFYFFGNIWLPQDYIWSKTKYKEQSGEGDKIIQINLSTLHY